MSVGYGLCGSLTWKQPTPGIIPAFVVVVLPAISIKLAPCPESVGSYFGSRWPIRPPARVWQPMTIKPSWRWPSNYSAQAKSIRLQDLSHPPRLAQLSTSACMRFFVIALSQTWNQRLFAYFCWPLTISVTFLCDSTPFKNSHCTSRFKKKTPLQACKSCTDLLDGQAGSSPPIPSTSPSAACSCKNSKSLRADVKAKGGL